MKISRRYILLTLVLGIIGAACIVFMGVWGAENGRRAALTEEILLVEAMCKQWGIETGKSAFDYPTWECVLPYGPTPGWKVDFPPLRHLISGDPDAWRSLHSIRCQKSRHFYPEGKDPFGNPLILNQVGYPPAIHPRTIFYLAATPEGRALLQDLETYLPFSRPAAFFDGKAAEIDLIRTIERAALFGQAAELKSAIERAVSEEQDFAARVEGFSGYDFKSRSAASRQSLLKPAELLQEVDSILKVLEDSKSKSDPTFASAFLDKHIENYRAVRQELEQLQKNLGQ